MYLKKGIRYLLIGNLLYQVIFFLIFDYSILTLCSFNIICDSSFLTFDGSFTFFFHINGFILTLCSSNITCDIFFSSHLVVFLLFLTFDDLIIIFCSSNITCDSFFFFFHIWWFPYFFFSHI